MRAQPNDRTARIGTASELEHYYGGVFTHPLHPAILGGDESEVAQRREGVKAAGGALWFNQFCIDAACTHSQFLITRIND